MKDIRSIVRPNILELIEEGFNKNENEGKNINVHLDANENPFNAPHNRYSDHKKSELKNALSQMKGIWPHCIALCNGTDEAIDFVFRIFCRPQQDNVLAIEPTSRKYSTYAKLNDVEYRIITLDENFQISADYTLSLCNENTKVIFLCSPNNPTGNLLNKEEVLKICDNFGGIVVVDEAYHEFSRTESLVRSISSHHNLVVTNTLSKTYASADFRLSIVYAIPEIIKYFYTIIPLHHINKWTQEKSLEILKRRFDVDKWINQLLDERRKMMTAVKSLPICERIYPTDANFFLARFKDADDIHKYLLSEGIAVYKCTDIEGCENCLRITIGLPNENSALIGALRKYLLPPPFRKR